jgi:hypothetical protein
MHNFDVMHQERNIAESIVSMCMNITAKTKDNFKARSDIAHVVTVHHLSSTRGKANPVLHFV